MKYIVGNVYLKEFRFFSQEELYDFLKNQKAKKRLFLEETFGENYYCYICYHSLTGEQQFVLSFCSEAHADKLNCLFWNNLLVLDTGKNVYIIDEGLHINASLEITTPLVGLYLIGDEKLLVLEEAYLRIVDRKGQIIRSELFDLMEDFSIHEGLLSIQTSEGDKVIELT